MEGSPESVFTECLKQSFLKHFIFVGRKEESASSSCIVLWDYKHKNEVEMNMLSEVTITTALSKLIDIYKWVCFHVPGGVPDFIQQAITMSPGAIGCMPEKTTEKIMKPYMFKAFNAIYRTLPYIHKYQKVAQGIHWLSTTEGNQLFVVNGSKIFRGSFATGELQWFEVKSPVYENTYYFKSPLQLEKPWSENINSLEDLKNAPPIKLSHLLSKNYQFFRAGWTFKHQDEDAYTLSLWAILLSIGKIFPQNLQLMVSAERMSGKTKLWMEAFGGANNTPIHITEHTVPIGTTTSAGLIQNHVGSSLSVILDEFDANMSTQKVKSIQREILLLLRGSSAGKSAIYKGTKEGTGRVEEFCAPMMLAGIDPDVDAATESRLLKMELVSGLRDRESPEVSIAAKFTPQEITQLRQGNTLGALPYAAQLIEAKKHIEEQLSKNPTLFGGTLPNRYVNSIVNLLSVLKIAKEDGGPESEKLLTWQELGCQIYKVKYESIQKTYARTSDSELLDKVFTVFKFHKVPGDLNSPLTCLKSLIYNPDDPGGSSVINFYEYGLYSYKTICSNPRYYLFMDWQRIASSLLLKGEWSRSSPTKLCEIVSRHPDMLNELEVTQLQQVAQGIPTWGVSTHSFAHVTVLDLTQAMQTFLETNAKKGANLHRMVHNVSSDSTFLC